MAIVVDAHSDLLSDILGRRAAGQTGRLWSHPRSPV